MDDVLQQDGKVLQTDRQVEKEGLGRNDTLLNKFTIPIRYRAECFRVLFKGMLLELILAHHLGCEILLLIGLTPLSGQDRAAGCLPFSKYRQAQSAGVTEPVSKYVTSKRRNMKRVSNQLCFFQSLGYNKR